MNVCTANPANRILTHLSYRLSALRARNAHKYRLSTLY